MVKKRPAVKSNIKNQLIREAGMKCANPGCINYRTHIHHIREWAVYETHDKKHMIAICPSCHDEIHHGKLSITDERLYEWKNITNRKTNRDQVFVEPGQTNKLLLGSIAVQGDSGLSVFRLSDKNFLSFKIVDNDIYLVNLQISTLREDAIIKIVQNNVKYDIEESIEYFRRTGKLSIKAPMERKYIPRWALKQVLYQNPDFNTNILTLLDVEVIKPGVVKVMGTWVSEEFVILITDEELMFIRPGMREPITLIGEGENAVLYYKGDITKELFNL